MSLDRGRGVLSGDVPDTEPATARMNHPGPGPLDDEPDIVLRDAGPGDRNFILDSWLRSLRQDVRAPAQLFYGHYRPLVTRLLDSGRARVHLAVDGADPDYIASWLCATNEGDSWVCAVHYAFTKNVFRGFGLCRRLLGRAHLAESDPIDYTAPGSTAEKLAEKFRAANYVPLEKWLES